GEVVRVGAPRPAGVIRHLAVAVGNEPDRGPGVAELPAPEGVDGAGTADRVGHDPQRAVQVPRRSAALARRSGRDLGPVRRRTGRGRPRAAGGNRDAQYKWGDGRPSRPHGRDGSGSARMAGLRVTTPTAAVDDRDNRLAGVPPGYAELMLML